MSFRVQRLLVILSSLIMIISAVFLILYNSKENISYFYTPSELYESEIKIGKKVRIGGIVKENSFIKKTSSSFEFYLTDNLATIKVTFNGILPDLFREGQGAVIEGNLDNSKVLRATNVFAKHDENYMPSSIKEDLKNKGFWKNNY